ncbi:MAG: hypothetical protein IPM29_21250 [Planctomycetes bacterium]|nr:hypothetical protein [Planctomycetota bacterium]
MTTYPARLRRAPLATLVLAACAATFAGCDSSSESAPTRQLQTVHRFQFDPATHEYVVDGQDIPEADVQRDLAGSLCSRCHAEAVTSLMDSVHFRIAAPTERVMFPGGGAHGMLDRACGLPATTGLTNYTSDINLGECAKCHVGRYAPMMEGFFAAMFGQMGVTDPTGQAHELVVGGLDCLICHSESYAAVPDGVLANVAGAAGNGASPTPVGSARAARDNGDFDHDGDLDLVIDMDGDGVADAPLMYDADGNGQPDTPWPTVAQDRSVAAIATIGRTTEHTCLRCHEHARTGYKRGTLFAAGHDVHATLQTGPFETSENRCTACHRADDHKFVRGHMVGGDLAAADHLAPAPGAAPDPNDPTDLRCDTCHDVVNDPVLSARHLADHVEKIACETCHIPAGSGITYSLFGHGGQVSFGRNPHGKDTLLVVKDMYEAGDAADLDADFDAYRTPPILMWFDGGTSFLAQSLSARGMPNAKITPFKPMANGMVFDTRYFDGAVEMNEAGASYNAHSMYRFFANGNNAEAFAGLGLVDMTPTAIRQMTVAGFQSTDPDVQTMALMLIFPNLVYFDKANFGYEHYLTRTGSPFDVDDDGIIDPNQPFLFDMLEAANAGLRQFQGFNGPMGFPANYEWYPPFQDASELISMKLPDGSLIKMFLQMQFGQLPEPQRSALLAAIDKYPSYSQITLGGHGVAPASQALGSTSCRDCHSASGALGRPIPVGRKVPTNMGPMGTIEFPLYAWRYYDVRGLVDLGLAVQCEDIVAGTADVDIDGDTRYLRTSAGEFVVNWLMPDAPGGFAPADAAASLDGTGLTAQDLTWNGGRWMPVLEPVVELVPNWQVLGLPSSVIWN